MPQLFDAQNAFNYWVHDYRPGLGAARAANNPRNPIEGKNHEEEIQIKRANRLLGLNYLVPRFPVPPGNFPAAASPANLPYTAENMTYERDVAMWYGTLQRSALIDGQGNIVGTAGPGLPPAANQTRSHDFLKRIFALLLYASSNNKFLFKRQGNWYSWGQHQIPIASALSHGGRVLIELTSNTNQVRALWQWLFQGVPGMRRRTGTHGVEPLTAPQGIVGLQRHLKEIKTGMWDSNVGRVVFKLRRAKLNLVRELGTNIGLGGYNQYNFISGKRIKLDGTHGHLYIYRARPEPRRRGFMWSRQEGLPGCIMIGCEGSAPIDCYEGGPDTRRPGTKFTGWAYDQTGHAHKLGGSGRFSPTGGLKWKEKEWHTTGPDVSCDGMYVKLDAADVTHLTTGAFNLMQIHGATTWNDNLVGYNCLP